MIGQGGSVAPPQDLDAERSVLGAVLLSDVTLNGLQDEGLRPEHFYREAHGHIYHAMVALQTEGHPVDLLTLRDRLSRDGLLEHVGGAASIEMLTASVPGLGNVKAYANVVVRKAVQRWRLSAAYDQITAVLDEDDEAWSKAIAEADGAASLGKQVTEVDPAEDFVQWYEGVQGLATPYKQLTDAIGGGLVPGDITVIGAWPGFGKTIMSDTFVLHVKTRDPAKRCHIYINELSTGIRTARMLARMTNGQLPWQTIRDRMMDKDGREGDWKTAFKTLPKLPAKYERSHNWHVEDYVRHIRRNKWDLAVIDSASRIPNRDTHELEQIVGALADVAGETGCHLILLVQLNLERCKTLERPMPLGRDLLGGGAWYRDARQVLFVHRAQEVMKVNGQDKAVPLAEGMIYADKATHGEPEKSMVPLKFNARRMVFEATTGEEPVAQLAERTDEDIDGLAKAAESWGF